MRADLEMVQKLDAKGILLLPDVEQQKGILLFPDVEEQKGILADKKNKLDAGMVSKYDYYNIQYNYLTQELSNIQLGFKSFISEVDFIYNLGGQNGTGKK